MLDEKNNKLNLSIIIPTYNRADFLPGVLDSIVNQSIDKSHFEVIVVDDGSKDKTKDIVMSYYNKITIRYSYQSNSGISTAKNHGIFLSKGQILLFLDDDDIVSPDLFKEHIKIHNKHKEENYAVLGYTTWHDSLPLSPLMKFIVGDGGFLFSYGNLNDGDILDYKYFWGGRSSCKRNFLIKNGVFNQMFKFGCEDIELGYRLQKNGLKVIYNKKATSQMIRPINFDDFIKRLYKQGWSQYYFYRLHENAEIGIYTEYYAANEVWIHIKDYYDRKLDSTKKINDLVEERLRLGLPLDDNVLSILHDSYKWIFIATKFKGIIDAKKMDVN